MAQSSQEGFIGLKTQAAETTYLDPGAADGTGDGYDQAGYFMPIRSGALAANRELLVPDPEIGGNRDVQQAVLGPISYSGEYEFYARPDSLAMLITSAFGSVASTPTGMTFDTDLQGSHVITPTDTATNVPWISVEEQIGVGYETFNYTDARVNTVHLEADADGYLMGSAGFIARTQSAGNTKTASPVFDDSPLGNGTQIVVNYNASNIDAKSFTFDFANNIEDDDFALGNLELINLQPKRRDITATFSLRDNAATDFWREATYGGAAATSPQAGTAVNRALTITWTSDINTPAANPYSVTISMPNVAMRPFNANPSGDDVIQNDFEVVALRPAAGTAACTITIVNGYGQIV